MFRVAGLSPRITGGYLWICIADREQGIFQSLIKVHPELIDEQTALHAAFETIISGRSPEQRGNGLKFVKHNLSTLPGTGIACKSGAAGVFYGAQGERCTDPFKSEVRDRQRHAGAHDMEPPMKIEVKKFGDILTSRPAGREAGLTLKAYFKPAPGDCSNLILRECWPSVRRGSTEVLMILRTAYGKSRSLSSQRQCICH